MEDAKKKEIMGQGKGYSDEVLKAEGHDKGDGKIDSQHAEKMMGMELGIATQLNIQQP